LDIPQEGEPAFVSGEGRSPVRRNGNVYRREPA
jgi:hypothetical protein